MSYTKRYKKNGKTYLAEVRSKRVNNKVVTEYIRYLGKEVDGKTHLSISLSNIEIEQVKVYGPLILRNYSAILTKIILSCINSGNLLSKSRSNASVADKPCFLQVDKYDLSRE